MDDQSMDQDARRVLCAGAKRDPVGRATRFWWPMQRRNAGTWNDHAPPQSLLSVWFRPLLRPRDHDAERIEVDRSAANAPTRRTRGGLLTMDGGVGAHRDIVR